MRTTPPGRRVAPSDNAARGTGRGGNRLRRLQSPSAVQRKRVLGQRDYRRGYFSRFAAQLFADPFGSNRKKARQPQKPKTMPLYNSQMDLCRDMRSLSISDISAADLSFSEKGDWDGEDGLAMQILTATWFDDLSYNDDSGCGSSRSSSISSGCRTSSWESLSAIFTPPAPKFSFELPEPSQGLDIKIDLGTSIQNFQTAVLPYGNIDMYMQNRSQYHRLAQADDDKEEFKQVKCSCCGFMYIVPADQ
ncbi:uncharacterized protein LOC124595980 [Schistocerca americana]|uniref:uncharacterized protein LOC124595980 n=1 Tax=Schistocerca americana TaxID=7009 RepID=UPI001F4F8C89|nr:uncharacterized protein LOC124595980 [Schistocerca americana]XP_049951480.1 uncharacterized protein LOC126458454 isoform X1 [Schistocerca serialis cubense]